MPTRAIALSDARTRFLDAKNIVRVLWSGGEDISLGRMLLGGAIVCGIYSVLNLWVAGIYQDEVVVPAQIITGAVAYPAGHPHALYYTQAFSLQNYLAAAIWTVTPNPFILSALRNILFLFLSVYVPFAFALKLTRRPFWGYVAAALTVSETGVLLMGVYPIWVFPNAISQGHIGMELALLTVVLLLAGQWWIGGLALGALPAVHPAMAALVYPWTLLYLLRSNVQLRGARLRRFLFGVGLGLAACVTLAGIIYFRSAGLGVGFPYDVQADGAWIRQNFVAFTDVHRQPFSLLALGYFLNPLAFFAIGALLLRGTYRDSCKNLHDLMHKDILWVLALAALAWIFVYGARIWMSVVSALPVWLDLAMPFRFSNLTALLMIPMTVAGIAWAIEKMDASRRPVGMLMLVGLVLLEGVMLVTNRVRAIDYVLFLSWGLFLALDLHAHWQDRVHRILNLLTVLVLTGVVGIVYETTRQGGALFFGFLIPFAVLAIVGSTSKNLSPLWTGLSKHICVGLLGVCLFAGVIGMAQHKVWDGWMSSYDHSGNALPRWDTVSETDRALIDWLAANTQPDELVLASLAPRIYLQAKTGHPVLMEQETLWLMTYMPVLAPRIGMMARDLYGIDYADRDQLERLGKNGKLSPTLPVWSSAWETRTRQEWETLGKKYGFRIVLSSSAAPLDLPLAFKTLLWSVYLIP